MVFTLLTLQAVVEFGWLDFQENYSSSYIQLKHEQRFCQLTNLLIIHKSMTIIFILDNFMDN
jgi:hypothetical protein